MFRAVSSLFEFLRTASKEVGIAAVSWIIDTNWSTKLPMLVSVDLCKEIHKATILDDKQVDGDASLFRMFEVLIKEVQVRIFAKKSIDASNCLRLLFLLYKFNKHKLQKPDAHLYAILNSCSRSLMRKSQLGTLQVDACISIRSSVLESKIVILKGPEFEGEVDNLIELSSQCTEELLQSAFAGDHQLALIIDSADLGKYKFLLLVGLSGVCYHGRNACVLYFSSAISKDALKDAFDKDIYPVRTFALPIPGQEDQEVARRIKSEASICSMTTHLAIESDLDPSMRFIVPYM
ncbi:Hypothetical protein GLP15_1421 [Giardia lamblia P15]|uniref:Uncharacterized protein n=1 Tax=Giardia intestinalis (strain P15) TaxID=658858 RepID=E1F4U6_GIAIA|nr:Hypothetical protein GLP15_1421 [Giardia lamblia P15]